MRAQSAAGAQRERATHREEHNGHGERDCGEHGHTHTQDQGVVGVDPAVGMQQLRLHFVWRESRSEMFRHRHMLEDRVSLRKR